MHRTLSAVALSTLVGAALLVPTSASATPHWGAGHRSPGATAQAKDGSFTWTVQDHKVALTSDISGSVDFVYTCGSAGAPAPQRVSPALFQTVYNDGKFDTAAFSVDSQNPVDFTCDGVEHTYPWTFPFAIGSTTFENGNGEVGLALVNSANAPTFEHVQVGGLADPRAEVAVTVDASPEPARKNKKITVKGVVERDGKAYKGKKATLYFQADSQGAKKVASAKADRHGALKTAVKVRGSGSFFWVTTSTSTTQAAASAADHVKVK